jgi:ATP phosphoribosyltransferase regulatory subunit
MSPALRAATRSRGETFLAAFLDRGATPFETAILQPAGMLLDLYGEDIRARAYTTVDPLKGEQMLRPDFTVPLVQHHIASGAGPTRYAYLGEVFRQQEDAPERPTEYLQAGYEVIGAEAAPEKVEAEVFATLSDVLAPYGLRAAMGDIGLLAAAVDGLPTTERRRAALRRHIWRPRRFRTLLERFAGVSPVPPARAALLEAAATATPEALMQAVGPAIGLRSPAEVAARIDALREDADAAPLPRDWLVTFDRLLSVRAAPLQALAQLQTLAADLPAIGPAVDRLAARLAAFEAVGVDLSALEFEVAYGRTRMEYYDGLVFGLSAEGRPDLPPVATGGRYDALTARLGRAVPAVGGVIRPSILREVAQ